MKLTPLNIARVGDSMVMRLTEHVVCTENDENCVQNFVEKKRKENLDNLVVCGRINIKNDTL